MALSEIYPQGTIFSGQDTAMDRALEGSNVCFASLRADIEQTPKKCCETDETRVANLTESLPCWVAVDCRSPADADEANRVVQAVKACVRGEKGSDDRCIARANLDDGEEEDGARQEVAEQGEALKVGERFGLTTALAVLAVWVMAVGLC